MQRTICTFKPKINEYKHAESEEAKKLTKHTMVSTSKSTSDRCQVLYDLSKRIVKHEDKPTDDYMFEKEKDQYTFAPNLEKDKVVEGSTNDPMIGETIGRLKKGREERERVKKGTERLVDDSGMRFGIETNKFKKPAGPEPSKHLSAQESPEEAKKEKMDSARKNQEMKPVDGASPGDGELVDSEEKLYIDVNLGENVERIVVRRGDTASALAAKFAEEHCTYFSCPHTYECAIRLERGRAGEIGDLDPGTDEGPSGQHRGRG